LFFLTITTNALGTVKKPVSNQWLEGYEKGCSREVKSLRGMVTFYWIEFDEPQIDADGDGPYSEAEIESEFLVYQTNDPN
jgi:hypothetical protein